MRWKRRVLLGEAKALALDGRRRRDQVRTALGTSDGLDGRATELRGQNVLAHGRACRPAVEVLARRLRPTRYLGLRACLYDGALVDPVRERVQRGRRRTTLRGLALRLIPQHLVRLNLLREAGLACLVSGRRAAAHATLLLLRAVFARCAGGSPIARVRLSTKHRPRSTASSYIRCHVNFSKRF